MLIDRNGQTLLEQISFDAYSDCQRSVALAANQTTFDNSSFSFLSDIAIYQHVSGDQYTMDFTQQDNSIALQNIYDPSPQTIYVGQRIISEVDLFPPELSQVPQSSLGNKAKVQAAWFFFYKTQAPSLNGDLLELYDFASTPMDSQKPFTGRHLKEGGDWSDLYDVKLTITHDKPLPFHMQAIAIDISINER